MKGADRYRISVPIAVAILLASGAYVFASDGMTANQATPISITGPDGVCKKVTNNSGTGLSEYIPTATVAEWQSFVANPPAGVTLSACTYTWTWTQRTSSGSGQWWRITSSADGMKLAAFIRSASIYTSADGGATWTKRTAAGSRNWTAITSSADGSKLAAAPYNLSGQPVYTSADSGATWTGHGSGPWYWVTSSADGTKLAAVGFDDYNGFVYVSADSGASWTKVMSAKQRAPISVAMSSDGSKIVLASESEQTNGAMTANYIFRSIDNGSTWTQLTSAGQHLWVAITSAADGTVIAAIAGDNHHIYVSQDSGATWADRTPSGTHNWATIASSADGSRFVIGEWATGKPGSIYTSADYGATWTAQTGAGTHYWTSVASSADGLRIAATDGNGTVWTGVAQ